MNLLQFLTGFLWFSVLFVESKKAVNWVKCNKMERREGFRAMTLQCGKNRVIYDVNLFAERTRATKLGGKNTTCTGWTPKMLIDINSCYWKRKCLVHFPRDPIVKIKDPSQQFECSRYPTVVKLGNYSCMKKQVIKDICENSGIKIAETDGKKKHGVIRSHSTYPWNYKTTVLKNNIEFCNITLQPKTSHTVVVFVDRLSIDTDDDSLIAHSTRNPTKPEGARKVSLTTGKHVFRSGEEVTLEFDINKIFTNGGSGFTLCYKFYRYVENASDSICKKITKIKTTGKCRKKCRKCKRKKRRTWK